MNINRKEFLNELQFLAPVCEKKSTIFVLSYFRFIAEGNKVSLRASNLDLTADTSIEIEGLTTETLSFCLPLFETINALKNMTDDLISLTIEDSRAWIKGKKTKVKLPIIEVDIFPSVDNEKSNFEFSLSADLLKKIIRLTQFASSEQQSRFTIQNVYLKTENKKLSVWATDGMILSYLECKNEIYIEDKEFSFPRYFAAPCMLLCEKAESITIKSSNNFLEAKTDKRSILTRLISGKSPNVQMIRNTADPVFFIDSSELKKTVNAVHGFEDLLSKATTHVGAASHIVFENKDESVFSYSKNSEYAAELELEAEKVREFPTFALDGFYFNKFLTALGDKKVEVIIKNAVMVQFKYSDEDLTLEFYQSTRRV